MGRLVKVEVKVKVIPVSVIGWHAGRVGPGVRGEAGSEIGSDRILVWCVVR
jgi:hypothetical protein